MQRRRFRQVTTLEERLLQEAERVKAQADALTHGIEKERLLKRARQAETAARLNAWLTSPGLRPSDKLPRP
ncbi:hypothetical protein [Bradyrhizobium japonicum]|jgi:hypothetical protein|uniref:hypothetical protein n=1 Tax=Bradyrhizobium japonicum TaxID=375 RepID=UPI0004154AA8|nr:hypothetical protein [Bradyrhizobium japonicum]